MKSKKTLLSLLSVAIFSVFMLININAYAGCSSGGQGASGCETSAGADFGPAGASKGCGVTCKDNYYACCSVNCRCVSMSDSDGPTAEK